MSDIFFHFYTKIKVDSYDSLPIEKRLTLHNLLIKSVFNKDKNHYYYNVFLEKCTYQLAKNYSQKVLRFGETKVTKEKFYAAKKPIKIWNARLIK